MSVAIIHPVNKFKSIHSFHKNIDTVAMLTHDVLARHFRKSLFHGGIGSCTCITYVLLI